MEDSEKVLDQLLFQNLAYIIEQGKRQVVAQVNSTLTLVYWQVGHKINTHLLENQRAGYARQILSTLSTKLVNVYGKSFAERNLRRMIQFSELFPDFQKLPLLATQLSWSHFVELLPLKTGASRMYYARKSSEERLSIRAVADFKAITCPPPPKFIRCTDLDCSTSPAIAFIHCCAFVVFFVRLSALAKTYSFAIFGL